MVGLFCTYLEYSLEIIKFYIIFHELLGYSRRRGMWTLLSAVFLFVSSLLIVYGTGNILPVYLLCMIVEMELIFQGNFKKIAAISLWLACVVGILDSISRIIVWLLLDIPGNRERFISWLASAITIMVMTLFLAVLKHYVGKTEITIKTRYYIFFFLLGMLYSVIMAYLQNIMGNMGKDVQMYVSVLGTAVVMYVQMGMVLILAVSRDRYREREELNREYLFMQEKYYKYLNEREEDTKKFRHDIREHLLIMRELCEAGNYKQQKEYLEQIIEKVHLNDKVVTVGNQIVDAVLNQYIYTACEAGVSLKVDGHFPENCGISSYDLCTIFANLLKNAVEAAEKSEKKTVTVILRHTEDKIIIYIKNDYLGERKKQLGKYRTTKENIKQHGIGLENIRECVKKYMGTLELMEEKEQFIAILYIPK